MEARAKAVGAPPLRYMYPQNEGLNAAEAARLLAVVGAGVVPRILPDLHVGAGGAVQAAAALFANPPVPGFNTGAINAETNANTHDLKRALDDAADLITWFTYDTSVTNRLYARTASFCSGSSSGWDDWVRFFWFFASSLPRRTGPFECVSTLSPRTSLALSQDQGISFFLPNMTWLQPPGYVHAMIASTWAEQTVSATLAPDGGSLPLAAQLADGGKTLVLRAVNPAAGAQPVNVTLASAAAAGPTFSQWTLGGAAFDLGDDNTPAAPTFLSDVLTTPAIAAGATTFSFTLEPHTFAVLSIALQ